MTFDQMTLLLLLFRHLPGGTSGLCGPPVLYLNSSPSEVNAVLHSWFFLPFSSVGFFAAEAGKQEVVPSVRGFTSVRSHGPVCHHTSSRLLEHFL